MGLHALKLEQLICLNFAVMSDRHWSGNYIGVNRCRRLYRAVGMGELFNTAVSLVSAWVLAAP